MSSDTNPVEVRVLSKLNADQEQINRLWKWAFNPGNDRNPIAQAVRTLFEHRDELRSELGDLKKVATVLRDDLKHLRSILKAYEPKEKT